MFDNSIRSLDRQGLTSGAIARRLGLSPDHVRHVLNKADVAETKPVYDAALVQWRKQREAEKRAAKARRAELEARRAKILRGLEAAEAKLSGG
jgi:orotate phosphoribosyltransferase-like protein